MPGTLNYRGAKIQMLDLPGIIEGAKDGKGRGRQVLNALSLPSPVLLLLMMLSGLWGVLLLSLKRGGCVVGCEGLLGVPCFPPPYLVVFYLLQAVDNTYVETNKQFFLRCSVPSCILPIRTTGSVASPPFFGSCLAIHLLQDVGLTNQE